MAEILQCAFCGGSGIQPRSLHSRCIACRGKGEIELAGPAIQCPSCKGMGKASNSSMLSCLRCKGIGAIEKVEIEKGSANMIGERLEEITKRLRWVRKETKKKEKEIEKKLEPIKPFAEEVKKGDLCLKELGNKIKKAWGYLWED